MRAEARIRITDGTAAQVAQRFNEIVVDHLPTGMWDAAMSARIRPLWRLRGESHWGEPGTVWVRRITCDSRGRFRPAVGTPRTVTGAWQEIQLFSLEMIDDDGRISREGPYWGITQQPSLPDWYELKIDLRSREQRPDCFAAMDEAWLVGVTRAVLEHADADYAVILSDYSDWTGWERISGLLPRQTWPVCRQVLIGYEWVTCLAPELAEQAGGVEGLRATGAFSTVEQVGRLVWAQATPTHDEYGPDQVQAVFHAFRNLIPDRPVHKDRPIAWEPSFVVTGPNGRGTSPSPILRGD